MRATALVVGPAAHIQREGAILAHALADEHAVFIDFLHRRKPFHRAIPIERMAVGAESLGNTGACCIFQCAA